MALIRPVARPNFDFNHNFEHGNATTAPKCSLTCCKTEINTSDDFSWCVSKADGGLWP